MTEDCVVLEWSANGVNGENVKFERKEDSRGKKIRESLTDRQLITRTPTLSWGSELASAIMKSNAEICIILHKSVSDHVLSRIDINILINRLLQSGSGIIIAALPRQINHLTGINAQNLPDCENRTCVGNVPDVRAIVGFQKALSYWLKARVDALQHSPDKDLIVFWSEIVLLSAENIGDSPSPPVEVDIFGSNFPPMPSNSDPIGINRQELQSPNNQQNATQCFNKCKKWCNQNQKYLWLVGIGIIVLVIIIVIAIAMSPTVTKQQMRANDYYVNPDKGGMMKGPILSRDPSNVSF